MFETKEFMRLPLPIILKNYLILTRSLIEFYNVNKMCMKRNLKFEVKSVKVFFFGMQSLSV